MALDTRSLDYTPVNIGKREIRLLEIQTGRDVHDAIVSRLINVKVTDDLEFAGLCALLRDSEDASTEDIWVNGCRLSVPATISLALRNVRAVFLREQASLHHTLSNTSSSASIPSPRRPPRNPRKNPGWLKHLLRGFRSILPDESSQAPRITPLRVFLDCICINSQSERETEQRRAFLMLAYGAAKITVGWLGAKDETSDTAMQILRSFDAICPPNFGTPEDRLEHPENYSPVMKWLAPIGAAWREDARVHGDPEKGPLFVASKNFIERPFFKRAWILEELTLSKFPAFLLGDDIISWMQLLQWNRLNEEFDKSGSHYVPKDVEETIKKVGRLDLSIVCTLLDEFDRRRDKSDTRGLVLSSSPESSAGTRPTTSKSSRTTDRSRENLTRPF